MKALISLLMICVSVSAFSQKADERIGDAINRGEWQKLRSLYQNEGMKLQTSLLHPLSKFFISHFYNQPDSALHYGTLLLNKHQAGLGGSVGGIIFLMAKDLAKKEDFKSAAGLLRQYNDAVKASGAAPDPIFIAFENQYDAIAQKGGFSISCPPKNIKIPVRYLGSRTQPGQVRVNVQINNQLQDAVYDTGSGGNIISKRLADELGLHIYDFSGNDIAGINVSQSSFTIVDSLRLGEIVYKNVPFQVHVFSTGYQEADSVINATGLECVMGLQSMFPLKEIQFDFKNGFLKIPATPSKTPSFAPNIYSSGGDVLVMTVFDKKTNKNIDAMLDTGAAVTSLTSKYYAINKDLFNGIAPDDSLRIAGVGGVKIQKIISTSWEYSTDGSHFMKEPIIINTESDAAVISKYDCHFGLPSLTKYDCVTINFKDMFLKLE